MVVRPLSLALAVAAALSAPSPVAGQDSEKPLRLADAIAEAVRNSPSLQPAADRVTLADIDERVARSNFGLKVAPTLGAGFGSFGTGQGSAGVVVSKRLTTGTELRAGADFQRYGFGSFETRDAGYSLTVVQPLLHAFGPGARADLDNAARAVASSSRGLEESRQRLVVEVAGAFYTIVRQQRLVEAGERALDRASLLRKASEARTKVGLATQLDVLRAELLASQAEVNLATQREALDESLDRLAVLLGRPVGSPLAIDAGDLVAPASARAPVMAEDVARLVDAARSSRLDVRELRERVTDAERNASIARWKLLPDVNLNAGYTRRGLGSAHGALLNDLLGGWRVSLTTSYSLDRTREAASAESAAIGVTAAQRALADREQQVAAEVRRAWRARERAGASIAIQAKAVDLARKQLRLAQLRYERGLAGNFDVVDADANLFAAESALIAAEVDRAMADLTLEHTIGALDPARYAR
jgi:outer membrane protein TolC